MGDLSVSAVAVGGGGDAGGSGGFGILGADMHMVGARWGVFLKEVF